MKIDKICVQMCLICVLAALLGCSSYSSKLLDTNPKFKSPLLASIVNDSSVELVIYRTEDDPITVIPPHETKTIHVSLEYYERNFDFVLFARPTTASIEEKHILWSRFRFENRREGSPAGWDYGAVRPETLVWTITDKSFLVPYQPPPSRLFNR